MRPADNPFRSDRIDALRPVGVDVPGLWKRLVAARRGALVGPHGTGKTTLLDALAAHAGRLGWDVRVVRLNHGAAVPRVSGPRTLVALDALEVLRGPAWLAARWRLRAAGVVVGTLHRAGRLPTLHQHTASADVVVALTGELLGRSAEPMRPWLTASLRSHDGNVRAVFRELYLRWADGDPPLGPAAAAPRSGPRAAVPCVAWRQP